MDNFFCSLYGAVLKVLRCDLEPARPLVAVCEVGPNGKPCGAAAHAPSVTPMHVASTTTRLQQRIGGYVQCVTHSFDL